MPQAMAMVDGVFVTETWKWRHRELPGTAQTTQHSVAEAETVPYFTAHSGAHGG